MDLGPIETAYLVAMVLVVVFVLSKLSKRLPHLVEYRGWFGITLLLVAEVVLLIYGVVLSGFLSSMNLATFFPPPPDPVVKFGLFYIPFIGVVHTEIGLVPIPFIGFVQFSNVVEGVVLTLFALFVGRRGVIWTMLFLMPIWVLFHDGIYFLITDLLHGSVPFLYSEMLKTYPTAYFGQFLVDIFQAVVVIIVFSRVLKCSGLYRLLVSVLLVIIVFANVFNFTYIPVLGDFLFMILYTAFIYLILTAPVIQITPEDSRLGVEY